jgi:hypothetical protein
LAIFLFVTVAFAVMFYRAAEHERLNPLIWSVASLAITGIVILRAGGIGVVVLGQVLLFIVLWWYNVKRKGLA